MSAQTLGLAITAVGMVSSLGLDAVTSCAAARAGLVRPSTRDDFMVRAGDTDEQEALHVHAVPVIADGFTGLGRLLRLGAAALADLQRQAPLTDGRPTGLLVNLPSGGYHTAWEQRLEAEEGREYTIDGRYEMAWRREEYVAHLVPRLCRLAGIDVEAEHRAVLFEDQAGLGSMLLQAAGWLAAGRVERCLVGGIGSHLESHFLRALYGLHMLNVPSQPDGLIPGEAAAFLLVEPARPSSSRPEATVGAVSLAAEPRDRFTGDPPRGKALAQAVGVVLQRIPVPDLTIGDLNGEALRAGDWGYAIPLILADHAALQDRPVWYPAASFGDVGAAAGPVAVCLALHLLRRSRSADSALLWLTADGGARAALTVHVAHA